jgi:8-oxo-dGTP pyrophosphatase MutT (NUDIX family)
MSFTSFIEKLRHHLQQPLPGGTAHAVMNASSSRWLHVKPDDQTRKSAVLVVFYPMGDQVCFPLIVRPVYDGAHSGQVAFPGGKYELTDESLMHTALREAQEEVGVNISEVKILGSLSEVFIAASNFVVVPFVGYVDRRPDFVADPREVERILEVDVNGFSTPVTGEIQVRGEQLVVPYYEVDGEVVWGATAKMISELLLVIF